MASRSMKRSRSASKSRSRGKSRSRSMGKSRSRSVGKSRSMGRSRSMGKSRSMGRSRSMGKSRSRGRSRSMKGGMSVLDPAAYSSASTYGEYVNGTVADQFARVFDQAGIDGKFQSNASVGAQGQNLGPSPIASYKMNGGKRSRRSRKSKKGGFFAGILNQAAVPFSLVGLNHLAKSMKKK